MNNQQGMAQSKLLTYIIVIIAVILLIFIVSRVPETKTLINNNHKSSIQSLSVAIEQANKLVHEQALKNGAAVGVADISVNDISINMLNGSMRATRSALENGLDVTFDAKDTIHSAVADWDMDIISATETQPGQVKVFAPGAPENCYLVYTEAGTEAKPATATHVVIDKGC
ncbi:hypothetical protein D5R81_09055 [Parashewanella spongiae]|uniref:MSHA biogenesis protein MshA n=1 Tax=Parashewanella spongiae TaxID=342950 RepID=A0A3A6TKT4_9GAMM|nr:hypothetical protein [Parashewanella spongiae]MCL1077988.1 hypothetical protein [Parashewanella spongiae]RJY16425.1 hypothetical protein D5R81_09055 [Parashewanella spongiae]